jgi:hypothetical protein
MSEAACGKSVEIKGSKSDNAELGQTYGKGQYQVTAREPKGRREGHHSTLVRKRRMREKG